jgi:hypothetical protein
MHRDWGASGILGQGGFSEVSECSLYYVDICVCRPGDGITVRHDLRRGLDEYAELEVRAAKRVEEDDHDYEHTIMTGSSSD